jgi:hypothetical protein
MVILGAGASFDSWPGGPPTGTPERDRPPLARDLFDERYAPLLNEHRKARFAVDRLRAAVKAGADVEQELEKMRDLADRDSFYHSHLMAIRYYLRDLIGTTELTWSQEKGGVTNYVRLVGQVREWARDANEAVCYVTFNYDMLLDRVLEDQLGLWRGLIDSYVRAPHHLIKFHGSVNWFRLCGPSSIAVFEHTPNISQIIDRAAELEPTGEVQVWGQEWSRIGATTRQSSLGGPEQIIVPALSIPLQRKAVAECPTSQLELLEEVIPQTTRVLIVGWRGAEKHFWNLWKGRVRTDVRVDVCCGGPDMPDGIAYNCPPIGIELRQINNAQMTFSALVDGWPSRLQRLLSL